MKLLLTGVTGQLGTAVAEIAPERGVTLVPLVRPARPGQVPFERAFPSLAAAQVTGDVREPLWGLGETDLDALAADVDAVVNLAGDTNWAGSGRDLYAVNVLGARNGYDVARELQRRSGRRVAYAQASSIYVVGGTLGRIAETPLAPDRHRTAYEHSKWLAERELERQHGPGDPDILISRVAALLGDSRTGATRKRNSLYLLAERWDELPGRVLPAMRGAKVDVLPRDLAAGTLLDAVAGLRRSGPHPEPVITHLSAGERAPTLRALLETARALSPLAFGKWVRLVPASAEQVLWLSANAERFLPLSPAWRNSLIGLRYIGLDRVMERGRLAQLVDGRLPEPSAELLARLLFDLPEPQRPLAPADHGLSRFLA
ncbi:SDR family oxidoreductase [Streptomyces sp. NPDC047070]|uniref:SDR family oxidoreductase n=1 Tax=Streptomyces sp. NPDC047070 TaxID=3154923 RepID=UPI00345491CA